MKTRYMMTFAFLAGIAAVTLAQDITPTQGNQEGPVKWVDITATLPAVGNIEAVEKWHYGRLENLTRLGTGDVMLEIRNKEGNTARVICPFDPFVTLAQVSLWYEGPKQLPGRRDYIERMVAFSADADGRVIGLVSLEPLPRNGRRIARAFGPR